MTSAIDRYHIERLLLDTLRDAAAEPVTALAGDLALGTSGTCADLAVFGGEWIGFVIRGADEPIDDVPRALDTCARYFDRVALVVDPCHLPALRSADLRGAALWSATADGLVEHAAGRANTVGMAALLDLLSPGDRRRLLRPLLPKGPVYDRAAPPIEEAGVRAHVERVLAAEHGPTAALLRAA